MAIARPGTGGSTIQLELGVARYIRRVLRDEEVDLAAPNPHVPEPDPAFVHATNWLLCEAGCDGVPTIAAESRSPSERPARAAVVELAGRSGPQWETVVERATRAYYQDVGYEPTTSGALRAVCDMFFGRVLVGALHPAVGAGCIGWYSWMTEHIPDHRVVQACNEALSKWTSSDRRTEIEGEICAMATAWQSHHQSHVPTISRPVP